jgi:epoxyqueuosine reductase
MKKTGGAKDLVTSLEASPEEVAKAIKSMDSGGLQSSPTWNCGKCMAYCPAGNWKAKFKDTKLSSHLPIMEW